MILCVGPNDKIQVVTTTTNSLTCHVSGADSDGGSPPTITMYRKDTAINTATTTDLTAAPASGHVLNVKTLNIANSSATTNPFVVQHTDGTTVVILWYGSLGPRQTLVYEEGVGWSVSGSLSLSTIIGSQNTTAQSGFAADTKLTGSDIFFPVPPAVGTYYRLVFDVTKTALGTATPILNIRIGTSGGISDTSRLTFTWGAGTAAVDVGVMTVECMFRTVGSGTAAVLVGRAQWVCNLSASGLSTSVHALSVVSGGFDSTVGALGLAISASYNGGASASHTIQYLRSELIP